MSDPTKGALQFKSQRYPLKPEAVPTFETPVPRGIMEGEMLALHGNLDPLFPDDSHRVIQFLGSQPGEGVSTIIREYAWLVVATFGYRVLILDACEAEGGQQAFFGVGDGTGWDQAVKEHVPLEAAVPRVDGTTLYVTGFSRSGPAVRVQKTQVTQFFGRLREMFDLVLIDSPPATTARSMNFKPWIDGIVLVVEAEKTRWPVVENVKVRILNSGNRILGMVFNKRRKYIPEFIYRRL
jgi:protein-tyrosine kinase